MCIVESCIFMIFRNGYGKALLMDAFNSSDLRINVSDWWEYHIFFT